MVENERVASLTQRERECLRLVGLGRNSKEIGQLLGLSNHTVDDHIRSTIRKLGAANRGHAAAILSELEGIPKIGGDQSAALAAIPKAGNQSEQQRRGGTFAKLLLPIGGRQHDLSFLGVSIAIVQASLFGLLGLTALVLVTMGLLWVAK